MITFASMEPASEKSRDLRKILRLLRNKYFLTTVGFVLLMLFFDDNNVYYLRELVNRKEELLRDKEWYQNEIRESTRQLQELSTSTAEIEKFGREKYYMKRDGEDVFVFIPED